MSRTLNKVQMAASCLWKCLLGEKGYRSARTAVENESARGNPASVWGHKIPSFPTLPTSLLNNVKHEQNILHMVLKDSNIVVQQSRLLYFSDQPRLSCVLMPIYAQIPFSPNNLKCENICFPLPAPCPQHIL